MVDLGVLVARKELEEAFQAESDDEDDDDDAKFLNMNEEDGSCSLLHKCRIAAHRSIVMHRRCLGRGLCLR